VDEEGADADDESAPPSGGNGWRTLTLTFRAPGAAVAALLGFGGDVEVLGPPEVRDRLVETARAALARHGDRP
jgi:predicted DNA-binding transcriptional regulator YafY